MTHKCTASLRALVVCLVVLVLFAGNVVAQDAMGTPQRPAPRIFIVTELGAEDFELTEIDIAEDEMLVHTVYRPRWEDIEVYDVRGYVVGIDALRAQIDVGSVVLVSADENPVDPVYLSIIRDDAFILVGVVVRVETE